MRPILAGLLAPVLLAVFLLGTGPAAAQERDGITATIQSQIDAFRADDFAQAFSYASPNIQGMFGNSERFGMMVRNGYPMVWRPAEVQYLELEDRGGLLYQKVMIRDGQGGLHLLEYQMVQNGGDWRINGVQLLRMPGIGA
ncbi:DUF4864 domain-containing protein [Dinoroseobacter sp. S375]|uniref:DUF4864 domain-containing protein n=1 Tax=Dinoroseobacter sp. S375 TaxID=3415136 RepID=UPI003C7C33C3